MPLSHLLKTGEKEMSHDQPNLPLDERFRQAEQYALELEVPKSQPQPEMTDGSCPHHKVFVYGCPYCDPR